MTSNRTSQIDTALLEHDPARGDQLVAHSERADAILHRVQVSPESLPSAKPGVQHSRRRTAISAGMIAAATVTAAVIGLVTVPVNGGHGTIAAPTWRLVSDVSPAWHVGQSSGYMPEFLPLACPASTTCYGFNITPGPTETAIEVTRDEGNTWQQLALPVTLSGGPSLTCSDTMTCAILGVDSGQPVFLETTDGGQTWSSHDGPSGLTSSQGMNGLVCTTAAVCLDVPGDPVGDAADAVAFVTTNGGATWSTSAMPSGFSQFPQSLQCASAPDCVVSGASESSSGAVSGAMAYTTDAGSSWSIASVPMGIHGWNAISCWNPSNCLAVTTNQEGGADQVLTSSDSGATWANLDSTGLSKGFLWDLSCVDSSECMGIVGGILASSSNGGQTFTVATMPPGVGPVFNVSCPNTTNCYALASQTEQGGRSGIVFLAYGS
jgi:photosystem II stability/assembly factor-like uncharacterized protein